MSQIIGPSGIIQGPLSQVGRGGGGFKLTQAPTQLSTSISGTGNQNMDVSIGRMVDTNLSFFVLDRTYNFAYDNNFYAFLNAYLLNSTTVRFQSCCDSTAYAPLYGWLYELEKNSVNHVETVLVSCNTNGGAGTRTGSITGAKAAGVDTAKTMIIPSWGITMTTNGTQRRFCVTNRAFANATTLNVVVDIASSAQTGVQNLPHVLIEGK